MNNPYVDMIDGRPLEPAYSNWMKSNSTPELVADSLAYKDEISTKLVETVDEYLKFSTTRDLIKLLAMNL